MGRRVDECVVLEGGGILGTDNGGEGLSGGGRRSGGGGKMQAEMWSHVLPELRLYLGDESAR